MENRLAREEWRRWYSRRAWRDRREQQLASRPLCRFCEQQGIVTEGRVVDHIEPHRGDAELFWHGDLQTLCKLCHDGVKQRLERGQTVQTFGLDGYPIDK